MTSPINIEEKEKTLGQKAGIGAGVAAGALAGQQLAKKAGFKGVGQTLAGATGGALGGFASVIYALYNNTISFQMGYRTGMDAFTAAVLGGIGSMPGAVVGGLVIGVVRALSDGYLEARWTNSVVFGILILTLVFRPSGLLGAKLRDKV
jgi:branched-chain amino acid transport system permease protein